MTLNALARNEHKIGQAHLLWKIMLELSKHDCTVVKFHSGNDKPSLLLDKPLSVIESKQTKRGDKTFQSGDFMGCRVYWEITSEDPQ